jgi:DNA-directed RNA polymerase specialized sigma24 family protein
MSPQAGWILQEEIVPRLQVLIPRSVRAVGSEDAEELVQDGIAIAAQMLHNAEAAGKSVTAGNIAHYTLQHMKSGRRSTGSSVVDVLQVGTQLAGHTRLTSLEDSPGLGVESGSETLAFHDVIANDKEDPSIVAARKMDWDAFCGPLSKRERCLVRYVAEGKSFRDVAQMFGVSDSTIQGVKRNVAQAIREFMGVDIMVTIRRVPAWKAGLNADRERQACREERRHS